MATLMAEPMSLSSEPRRHHSSSTRSLELTSISPVPPPRSPKRALSIRSKPTDILSHVPPEARAATPSLECEEGQEAREPLDMVDDGHLSDVSSICHSPSWADFGVAEKKRKQRKKEAKLAQKEQERQEKLRLKEGAVKPRRLSKAPPQHRQSISRSMTAPAMSNYLAAAVPTIPHLSQLELSNILEQASMPTVFPTNTMLGSLQDEQIAGEADFVSGLKLQQLHQNSIQSDVQRQEDRASRGTVRQGTDIVPNPLRYSKLGRRSSSESEAPQEFRDSTTVSTTALRTIATQSKGYDKESYAKRIAKEPFLAEKLSQNSFSQNESRYRSRSKRYTAIDMYSSTGRSGAIEAAKSGRTYEPVVSNNSHTSSRGRSSSGISPDRMSCASAFSSAQISRDDFSQLDFVSEVLKTFEPSRLPEEDQEDLQFESEDAVTSYHNFVTSTYVAPELALRSKTARASLDMDQNERYAKSVHRQSFSGFKQKAKLAFSKRSSTIHSAPSESVDGGPRPPVSSHSVEGRTSSERTQSKIERMFGEGISNPSNVQPRSTTHSEPPSFSVSSLSSASVTDRSDCGSSLEDHSNITTPTTSRPHSQQPNERVRKEFMMNDAELNIPEVVMVEQNPGLALPATTNSNPLIPVIPARMNSAVKLERRMSIPRSQSTPILKEPPNDLSFLPELKHQALTRPPPRASSTTHAILEEKERTPMTYHESMLVKTAVKSSPASSAYLRDARLSAPRPNAQLRRPVTAQFNPRRMSMDSNSRSGMPKADETPIAKMFVICCNCKFFHDLPSKIYEAMAKGPSIVQDADLGISGVIKTQVSCPWCQHGMSTDCCAGYAGVVYLRERFH